MKYFIATMIILLASSLTVFGDTEDDIKSHCSEKWGTDYRMIKYCQNKNFDALEKIQEKLDEYGNGSEEVNIINRCWEKWYPQTRMINYCANKQIEAYKSLQ